MTATATFQPIETDPTVGFIKAVVGDVYALAGPDWWASVGRVAATCTDRDEFDARTRRLHHDVFQAYQTLEGNALTPARKQNIADLRRGMRRLFAVVHQGAMSGVIGVSAR
jgi:hypothetical protein